MDIFTTSLFMDGENTVQNNYFYLFCKALQSCKVHMCIDKMEFFEICLIFVLFWKITFSIVSHPLLLCSKQKVLKGQKCVFSKHLKTYKMYKVVCHLSNVIRSCMLCQIQWQFEFEIPQNSMFFNDTFHFVLKLF